VINIAIIDQNEIYRAGLKTLLEQIDGFRVVAEAPGIAWIRKPASVPVQVVLLDNSFGNEECREMIRVLSEQIPAVKIIILVMFREELEFDFGATEVILKSSGKQEFGSRIRNLVTIMKNKT
jgi:DNA-binding NarL/FixJ family response regulator